MSSHYAFSQSNRLSNGFSALNTDSIEDTQKTFYIPSQTNGPSRHLQRQSVNLDELRAGLTRRYSTSNQTSNFGFSAFGQTSRSGAERPRSGQIAFPQMRPEPSGVIDRKQQEYELIKQKQARFKAEMEALEQQEEQLRRDLYGAGNQSANNTPPDANETGFPTMFSRPNRFSSSSVISPPSYSTRSSRAGSQATSPPNERDRALQALTGYPSSSVPGSRGDSEGEEEDRYDGEVMKFDHKKAASLNRNSMPITRRDMNNRNGSTDNTSFGHLDTTSFLFDDDTKSSDQNTPTAKTFPTYLQVQTTQDNFPTLRPIDRQVKTVSASNALDLANPRAVEGELNPGGWPSFQRQSMPPPSHRVTDSTAVALPPPTTSGGNTPSRTTSINRHSMGARITTNAENKRPSLYTASPPSSFINKPSSSYSASSVPTMGSIGSSSEAPANKMVANVAAEQRLHQHNMSLGRIPTSAVNSNRQSRDLSLPDATRVEEQNSQLPSLQSILQANAAAFGSGSNGVTSPELQNNMINQNGFNGNGQTAMNGYGSSVANTQALSALTGNMQIHSPPQFSTAPSYNQATLGYNPFQQMPPQRLPDNQSRMMQQQRRGQNGEEAARFGNVELSQLQGEIYGLCKDQHGCRFLQKKLEERKPENVELIFRETYEHMIELMTDPFGNYLCQKLLEHATEDQRTVLIESAAPDMVNIALNQHGTRALQKMIEFVSSQKQIDAVTVALQDHVVQMIQDLNGNHVIQKCLNRLSSQHIQFVVDAVSANCVIVGTHRHGCCVIQRCVDHADSQQTAQLVSSITKCSMDLVQDPFGNYVLQYIFDLDQKTFSEPLCETFLGAVSRLAKQKFSSNVIEKCLRVADANTKHAMIQEMLAASDFERLIDDNYANYVLQTALDQGTPEDENQLVDRIRPLLPRLRHKPHGRRYQNKINERDRRLGIDTSGSITPNDLSTPENGVYNSPYSGNLGQHPQPAFNNLGGNYSGFASPVYQYQAQPNFGYGLGQAHPSTQHQYQNYNLFPQGNMQQSYAQFGGPQQNGNGYY